MPLHDFIQKQEAVTTTQRQQTGFINIYLCPGNVTRTITDER